MLIFYRVIIFNPLHIFLKDDLDVFRANKLEWSMSGKLFPPLFLVCGRCYKTFLRKPRFPFNWNTKNNKRPFKGINSFGVLYLCLKITIWPFMKKNKRRDYNGPTRPLFCLFQSLQSNKTILQQTDVKNVQPVSGTRIQTHNLMIMSLLLQPLDQYSHLD